jgi:hypothetical protein
MALVLPGNHTLPSRLNIHLLAFALITPLPSVVGMLA